MGLGFDIRKAKVILIATSQYGAADDLRRDEALPDRPNILTNVKRFKDVLKNSIRDENGNGLQEDQFIELFDEASSEKITKTIQKVAEDRTLEFLLVLYTGHGVEGMGQEKELILTISSSTTRTAGDPKHPGAWISSERLINIIQRPSHKKTKKLVILDCCYSGLAKEKVNLGKSLCLVTSCQANKRSHEDAFLPVLSDIWEKGKSQNTFLTLGDILSQLPSHLISKQEWDKVWTDDMYSLPIARTSIATRPMGGPPLGLEFFKNTNRDKELTELVKLTAIKGKVKVGILHGTNEDRSLSLVDRFISMESDGAHFMPVDVDPEGVRHLRTIKLTPNINQYIFYRSLAEYFGRKNEDISKEMILAFYPHTFIVLNLEIYWGKETEAILSDFLHNFWKGPIPEERQVYIFLHLIYTDENPPRKSWKHRLLGTKGIWDQSSLLKKLEEIKSRMEFIGTQHDSHSHCVLVPKLGLVAKSAILELLLRHLMDADYQELIKEFQAEQYSMLFIEQILRPYTKRYR